MRSAFDWLFRNRRTGGITIGQFPNAPLLIWLAASAARLVLDPKGDVRSALEIVGTLALAWWAADELARGVNPFRRILGAAVLGAILVRLVTA